MIFFVSKGDMIIPVSCDLLSTLHLWYAFMLWVLMELLHKFLYPLCMRNS
jgi:hypothetical protein